MFTFVEGDVVQYIPKGAERHCREWQAIAKTRDRRIRLVDTFWGSGMEAHVLTEEEEATADWQFNLADYRAVERYETWVDFHPSNRVEVTHQHGLQRTKYVRIGSGPDMSTRIENAREKVREAERELESAKSHLRWATDDLDKLHAAASKAGAR